MAIRYEENHNGCDWIGLVALIGLVLVFMRMLGLIDWSWWIVLAPFYVPCAVLIGLFIFGAIKISIDKKGDRE